MQAKLLASITLVLSQFFVCFELSADTKHIKTDFIVIPSPNSLDTNGRPSAYFEQLLRLALSKTQADHNPVEFHYFQHAPEKERLRMMLIQNQGIDLIWSSSNQKREQEMLAIKVNLLKGINEYRILLIRAEDQNNFNQIHNLQDLQNFQAGMGIHWSDTEVFKKNNFDVFVTGDYQNMFSALRRTRFDFIPRGIQEIDSEIKQYGHLNLAAEKNLLLHYHQPIYFFVNKSNKKLAKRIKKGLKIAQEDGSFDQLFFEFPEFKTAYDQLQSHNRRVIELTVD